MHLGVTAGFLRIAAMGTLGHVIVALELIAAFVLIVGGAVWFTNAVEWLGRRLDLGAGAVGALLAAVGTALPESIIPIVALLGGGNGEQIQLAYGAIVGAPFMLATVAFALIMGSAYAFRRRREQDHWLALDVATTRRDLLFFLALFPIGIALGAAGVALPWRIAAAVALLCGYGVYVRQTVAESGGAEDEEPQALFVDTTKDDPPSTVQIAIQFTLSLAAVIGGAELFVTAIESIAESLGVSLLVLALILAPLATELPEKANSVIWVRKGKDALAAGNVTGALVFQAAIPVALGLLVTPWVLGIYAVGAGCVALVGGAVALWALPRVTPEESGGDRFSRRSRSSDLRRVG
jgi:cation:H+ antiporter